MLSCLWCFGPCACILQLNSLFSGRTVAAVSTDRPINVEGSSATSAFCATARTRERAKITPAPPSRLRKRKPQHQPACGKSTDINPAEKGDVTGLLPPFFGRNPAVGATSWPQCSRGNTNVDRKENIAGPEESSATLLHPLFSPVGERAIPQPNKGMLPTVRATALSCN